MQVRINKNIPLTVKAQIKGQVRNLIREGVLRKGDALPPVRDLAAVLGVNRNTVAAAYNDLASDGVLACTVGKGTHVKEGNAMEEHEQLRAIFDSAFDQALGKGFPPQVVADYLLDRIAGVESCFEDKLVLVVECNLEAARDIAASLRQEFGGVQTQELLISDIETANASGQEYLTKLLQGADLAVCGFNHLEEFLESFPDASVEVVGVLLKPNEQILNDLIHQPKGTRIGFTCVTGRSTEAFFTSLQFAVGQTQQTIRAGLDDKAAISRMLEACDIVYATHYAYQQLSELAPEVSRIVKVDLGVDHAGLEVVRRALVRA
jgi:DNA-binding transcriptional regulator YhcF (GntR family)